MTYQDRAGTYQDFASGEETDYAPFVMLDSRFNYQLKSWNFYAEASNLFDVEYYDLGNVSMPGRWIRLGMNFKFNYKK